MARDWNDARLDDLAATLSPLPVKVATLMSTVDHLDEFADRLAPVPAQVAVLAASVERLANEQRELREELDATHHQLVQIAWGLVAALIGAAAALTGGITDFDALIAKAQEKAPAHKLVSIEDVGAAVAFLSMNG
ncbi:MAG: hypothetical protein ACM3UV_06405, partial [Nocardioidaceae bacterium]